MSESENMNANQPPMAEVGEGSFTVEVLNSKQPVLVVFWAPWSRPCAILDEVLKELLVALAGEVKVVRANADDNPALSLWYDIGSVPTLLLFMEGKPRVRIVGTASKQAILAKLKPFWVPAGTVPAGDKAPPTAHRSGNEE